MIFIALLVSVLLVSCTKKEQETIATIVEAPNQQEAQVNDDMMMDSEHEWEWTEEEMKEMWMMDDDSLMTKEEHEAKVESGEWTEEEMKMMEDMEMMDWEHEWETMMEDDTTMEEGVYADYDSALVGKTENTVLFFHANWCPSCRAADTGISGGTVPGGLTILKTDYDSNTELKKKYKVLSQHTFVQVDANGDFIKKWVGGNDVAAIVENLK